MEFWEDGLGGILGRKVRKMVRILGEVFGEVPEIWTSAKLYLFWFEKYLKILN